MVSVTDLEERVKAYVLEGSKEEVQEVLEGLLGIKKSAEGGVVAVVSDAEAQAEPVSSPDTARTKFISYETAMGVLKRKPLNRAHKTMFRVLAEAYPDYVSSPDLMEELDMTSAQFRGFLGAFGRRISYTEDGEESWFFDQYWDGEEAFNRYRLPETSYQAIQDLGILE